MEQKAEREMRIREKDESQDDTNQFDIIREIEEKETRLNQKNTINLRMPDVKDFYVA